MTISSASRVTAAALTATDVLDRLRQRQGAIETFNLTALWREFKDGRPIGIEQEEIQRDKFGRIRVRYQHGPEGSPLRSVDNLYNGELTVSAVSDPTLDRLGGPHTKETREASERYRTAMIHDGLFPQGAGPGSHRNPLTFIENSVVRSLARVVTTGANVQVSERDGPSTIVELRFQEAAKDSPARLQNVVLVDPTKGWSVTSHEQFYPDDGSPASRTVCEYQADKNGDWLPKKGRWQAWKKGLKAPPSLDWQFEVERVAINEPDFDESVFEVSLLPGTYVNDIRHDVSYWVGQERAIGADLARLAQEAVAKNQAEERRLQVTPGDLSRETSPRRQFRYLIGVNVLIAASFAYLMYRRRKRQT